MLIAKAMPKGKLLIISDVILSCQYKSFQKMEFFPDLSQID